LAFKEALQADDFEVFRALMQPIVEEYGSLYKRSFLSKALSRIKLLFASK
jgi:hypothetical protein